MQFINFFSGAISKAQWLVGHIKTEGKYAIVRWLSMKIRPSHFVLLCPVASIFVDLYDANGALIGIVIIAPLALSNVMEPYC